MSTKAQPATSYRTPVVVVFNQLGMRTAQHIVRVLPEGARLHGLKWRLQNTSLDYIFTNVILHLHELFRNGHAIIGICASGILLRALGPILVDKQNEPPVIAVSVDGKAVVPLIGGHRGANKLAHIIAHSFNVAPAITTFGDTCCGLSLDEPPVGWHIANPSALRKIMAALIDNKPVTLDIEAGTADWITAAGMSFVSKPSTLTVRITDRLAITSDQTLVLHPPTLAIGVGCKRGVLPEILLSHVFLTLTRYGLSSQSVAVVVSIDLKADEPAVLALARKLAVPARFLSVSELEVLTPQLHHPSDMVFNITGCYGVAEAAALAAAGSRAALVVDKQRGDGVTCAIARATSFIDPMQIGQARGMLHIVGIGPGAAEWRTPAASAAIAESNHIVGYKLYLNLLGSATEGKELHDSPLGCEIERVRLALDLAAVGETVSLICSGDAGIYALATLVFELMANVRRTDWNRIEVNVIPGVSAVQAAAARVGAPLGNDFCVISLSDLLTPWPTIVCRLQAAAAADFIIAIYNPVSQRRRDQLRKACEILLLHRSPGTPVILARNLGRTGEYIAVIRLEELTPEQVDMLTIVLVGNSESRYITTGRNQWVYTPRGYQNNFQIGKM